MLTSHGQLLAAFRKCVRMLMIFPPFSYPMILSALGCSHKDVQRRECALIVEKCRIELCAKYVIHRCFTSAFTSGSLCYVCLLYFCPRSIAEFINCIHDYIDFVAWLVVAHHSVKTKEVPIRANDDPICARWEEKRTVWNTQLPFAGLLFLSRPGVRL